MGPGNPEKVLKFCEHIVHCLGIFLGLVNLNKPLNNPLK